MITPKTCTLNILLADDGSEHSQAAVKLLGDLAELDSSVVHSDALLEGTLRLAVPLSFGLAHLSPAIDEFLELHPGLDMHINFSDHKIDLLEQGVELAIRIAELDDSSLQARPICPVRLVLCASPDYLARHGKPDKPEDLDGHRVLRYDAGGNQPLKLRDREGRLHTVAAPPRIIANNGDFLRDMSVAGHGIYALPTFIAWQALRDGHLVPVLEDYPQASITAWAVYPRTRYLSQRARSFIDFLVQRFGEEPYWDRCLAGL